MLRGNRMKTTRRHHPAYQVVRNQAAANLSALPLNAIKRTMKSNFNQILAVVGIIFCGLMLLFAVSCTPTKYKVKKKSVNYDKKFTLKIGKKKPCGCSMKVERLANFGDC